MATSADAVLDTAERFRLAFEGAAIGLLVVDPARRVVDCNDALAKILHSTRQRVVGLSMSYIPDQRIVPTVDLALGGTPASYQGAYRSATSGDEIIAVMNASPIRDESGTVIGCIAVVEDATDRMKLQDELRAQLDVVREQSATIQALGTPILKVWEGVLCLPIIGTINRDRVTEMAETMLQAIIRERAKFALIDLTGVEVVDTSTAQNLLQLFQSARLVGTEALLCGLRPAVAQTIVSFGMELGGVRTMRTMQEALRFAIDRLSDR